jgi:hypothetical protein
MKLKIFIPDFNEEINKKICVPPLYPFVSTDIPQEKRIQTYGEWLTDIELVDSIEKSDIVMPGYYVNYYYSQHKVKQLRKINKAASEASKLTVCYTNGDWGITPPLKNFHLYRFGGYLSKNKGNQFCHPFFLPHDPLTQYFNNILPVSTVKPQKPIIGFCGRASNNLVSVATDTIKNIGRLALKAINRWHEDIEIFSASSLRRFHMLNEIEQSDFVQTNFIRYDKFLGGGISFADKENQRQIFYRNIKESHYIFCYRGWGNYSIRLYETMASGRIPVIVTSNNNLPFSNKINWKIFPMVNEADSKNIAGIVSAFHAKLSEAEFVALQLKAREIWREYFTYKGFMQKWVDGYVINKTKGMEGNMMGVKEG